MKFEYLRIRTRYNNKGQIVIVYKGKEFLYAEYRAALFDLLGNNQWELVSVVSVVNTEFENMAILPIRPDTFIPYVYTSNIIYYFKKEMAGDILDGTSREYKNMYQELKNM